MHLGGAVKIVLVMVLMGICDAQDEEEPLIPIVGDRPVPVFLEPMQKATAGITDWLDEMAVQAGHDAFLYDNWTLNLSNMTGLFTA